MKLKIGFSVVITLLLVVVFCNVHLVFAQTWDMCLVSCNCTDLVIDDTIGFFSFTVISPDFGVANAITVVDYGSGDNYVENLTIGDTVVVSYTGLEADSVIYNPGSGYLYYQDPADSVTINGIVIPEFPLFIILPLFMLSTLLVMLVYRRKHYVDRAD